MKKNLETLEGGSIMKVARRTFGFCNNGSSQSHGRQKICLAVMETAL
jgi:hypothetical protein